MSTVTAGTVSPLVITPTRGEPLATDEEGESAGRQRLRTVLTCWARGAQAYKPAGCDVDQQELWRLDHEPGSSNEGAGRAATDPEAGGLT